MNKISTSVVVGFICIALLIVLIYLNRDKFGTQPSEESSAIEPPAES